MRTKGRLPIAVVLVEQTQVGVGVTLGEPLDLVVGTSHVLGRTLLPAGEGIDDSRGGIADERASIIDTIPSFSSGYTYRSPSS